MKYLFLTLACFGLLSNAGCKKPPVPKEPEEYFSFDANGVHYDYPQIKSSGFTGTSQTIAAFKPSGSLGYQIRAYWLDYDPQGSGLAIDRGEFDFRLGGGGIPDKDTLILNSVQIRKFFASNLNSYSISPPYTGRMIFTERSDTALRGTFELQAVKTTTDTMGYDSVLTVTNGKFYIIPQS